MVKQLTEEQEIIWSKFQKYRFIDDDAAKVVYRTRLKSSICKAQGPTIQILMKTIIAMNSSLIQSKKDYHQKVIEIDRLKARDFYQNEKVVNTKPYQIQIQRLTEENDMLKRKIKKIEMYE
jgi:hypothetical protein